MLVFVAGVHGVGKGYICEKYATSSRALHKSASQLIKEYGDIEFEADKLTADIDRNQLILIAALKDLKSKEEMILLDGHFALVSKKGDVEKIDTNVFKEFRLDGAILIKNDISVIAQRLVQRDGNSPTYNLNELISTEENHARAVCEALNIPLKELTAPTIGDFTVALKEIGCEI